LSELTVETFMEPSFGENAYVLSAQNNQHQRVGWIVDPSFSPQPRQLLAYLDEHNIVLERIILTHGHADHVAGLDAVHDAHPDASVCLAKADEPMLTNANLNLSAPFGLVLTLETPVDEDLEPSTELTLGSLRWRVLDTSGHSPGGRSLYCDTENAVIVGDALFPGSIGRTDFPGSDHRQLIANIRDHLLSLPDETVVYSGHGPATTIGIERKSNPFFAE
jgi:glyoxylase-like metal-dependent hydrolase (beta-lactamase superfamily II)